mgnify:CR=1 FL=1
MTAPRRAHQLQWAVAAGATCRWLARSKAALLRAQAGLTSSIMLACLPALPAAPSGVPCSSRPCINCLCLPYSCRSGGRGCAAQKWQMERRRKPILVASRAKWLHALEAACGSAAGPPMTPAPRPLATLTRHMVCSLASASRLHLGVLQDKAGQPTGGQKRHMHDHCHEAVRRVGGK